MNSIILTDEELNWTLAYLRTQRNRMLMDVKPLKGELKKKFESHIARLERLDDILLNAKEI